MRVLTADQMRAVDRAAIDDLGIPGMVLMENAAIGVVTALAEAYPRARSVAIACGPGNNGGDGLAVGRHLLGRGYAVTIGLAVGESGPRGDAATQLGICERAGIAVDRLEDETAMDAFLAAASDVDLVVDALFGTGLTRALEGEFARLVGGLERIPAPRLAVDLPSGLDASRADLIGPHLTADLTVTFAAPKVAHVFPPAAEAAGEVVVTDLGFPAALIERAAGDLWLLEPGELAPALPARPDAAHKGTFGHALVVGGSPGKSGAVTLAARAALRAGTGLVTIAAPAEIVPVIEAASLETMTASLSIEWSADFAPVAEAELELTLADKSAWALGPGLGQSAVAKSLARRAIHLSAAPLVVDADGLNAFAGDLEAFSARDGETVLTPHVGELARLLSVANAEVARDRLGSVRRAAEASGCLVVLKGQLTLVADPRGGVFINPTGNPGMATAGTGDVLTGLICGVLAQGVDALSAAQLGVYLHGLAGDLAAEEKGAAGLVAGDLLELIPAAIERLAVTA